MYCPICKNKTRIIDNVSDKDHNNYYRKHRCDECNNIFYTIETIVEAEDLKYFKKLWKKHHRWNNKKKEKRVCDE